MRHSFPFGLALVLAVPLFSASRPAGAAPPAATPTWPAGMVTDAVVFAIARDAKGNATHDTNTEDSLTKMLKGELLILTPNGIGALGHLNGTMLVPDLLGIQVSDTTNTFAIMDSLTEDSTPSSKALVSFHANVVRETATSTTGFLQGHELNVAADGSSKSIDIFLNLTLTANPPATAP